MIARETTEPGPVRRASRWGPPAWLAVAAVALSALYLWSYGDALGTFFVQDDYRHLANNARIQFARPAISPSSSGPPRASFSYRPAMIIYYHSLFGTDPGVFHAVHLGFHLANAALVYSIATRLLFSSPLAVAVALVYTAAPGHAYAAYWIGLFTPRFPLPPLAGEHLWLPHHERVVAVAANLHWGCMPRPRHESPLTSPQKAVNQRGKTLSARTVHSLRA